MVLRITNHIRSVIWLCDMSHNHRCQQLYDSLISVSATKAECGDLFWRNHNSRAEIANIKDAPRLRNLLR